MVAGFTRRCVTGSRQTCSCWMRHSLHPESNACCVWCCHGYHVTEGFLHKYTEVAMRTNGEDGILCVNVVKLTDGFFRVGWNGVPFLPDLVCISTGRCILNFSMVSSHVSMGTASMQKSMCSAGAQWSRDGGSIDRALTRTQSINSCDHAACVSNFSPPRRTLRLQHGDGSPFLHTFPLHPARPPEMHRSIRTALASSFLGDGKSISMIYCTKGIWTQD